jgi:hypothetical protein
LSKISVRQRIDDRSTSFSPVCCREHKRNGGPPVIDDRRTNDEDRPAVSLSDCEAEWMERTRVVAFEDALAQLHTDHVPMSGTILQFRRRTA